MASHLMIDIIVAGIMDMSIKDKAQHAYCVLCVDLLDLYDAQYMKWGQTFCQKTQDVPFGMQHKAGATTQGKKTWSKTKESRINEKQILIAKSIAQNGRQMVYDQIKIMVTNVSGLFSRLPESTQCDEESGTRVNTNLSHLCPEMASRTLTARTRIFLAKNTGIHLLRQGEVVAENGHFESCLLPMPITTCIDSMYVGGRIPPCKAKESCVRMPANEFVQIEKKLFDVLENAPYVLAAKIKSDDPRRELIMTLRRGIALTYLDMLYSIWANV